MRGNAPTHNAVGRPWLPGRSRCGDEYGSLKRYVRRNPLRPSARVDRRGTFRPRLGRFSALSICIASERVLR
jgi:hypothetical protein